MINQLLSIRGATTIDADTVEEITLRSVELMTEIVEKNGLNANDDLVITDYLISTTDDITAFYPARAIRESKVVDAPIFSMKEPAIKGALPLCIRIMVRVANSGAPISAKHVYLRGAKNLRRDITDVEEKQYDYSN